MLIRFSLYKRYFSMSLHIAVAWHHMFMYLCIICFLLSNCKKKYGKYRGSPLNTQFGTWKNPVTYVKLMLMVYQAVSYFCCFVYWHRSVSNLTGTKNPSPGCNLGPKFSPSCWLLVRKKWQLSCPVWRCPWLILYLF